MKERQDPQRTPETESSQVPLPPELVQQVLARLQPAELCAVGKTCRQLHRAANSPALWARIFQRRFGVKFDEVPSTLHGGRCAGEVALAAGELGAFAKALYWEHVATAARWCQPSARAGARGGERSRSRSSRASVNSATSAASSAATAGHVTQRAAPDAETLAATSRSASASALALGAVDDDSFEEPGSGPAIRSYSRAFAASDFVVELASARDAAPGALAAAAFQPSTFGFRLTVWDAPASPREPLRLAWETAWADSRGAHGAPAIAKHGLLLERVGSARTLIVGPSDQSHVLLWNVDSPETTGGPATCVFPDASAAVARGRSRLRSSGDEALAVAPAVFGDAAELGRRVATHAPERAALSTPDQHVTCIAFSPQTPFIAAGTREKQVHVLAVAPGSPAAQETCRISTSEYCSQLAAADERLYVGTRRGVELFDVRQPRDRISLLRHRDTVVALQAAPWAHLVVSASHDRVVKVWDDRTHKTLHTLPVGELRPSGSGGGPPPSAVHLGLHALLVNCPGVGLLVFDRHTFQLAATIPVERFNAQVMAADERLQRVFGSAGFSHRVDILDSSERLFRESFR